MMKPQPWFSRKFGKQPDFVFYTIIERLEGTPLRIDHKIQQIDPAFYTKKIAGDTWSIQEQVGHLVDLEPLWLGRFQDILSEEELLRAADLSNQKTFQAQHHQLPITTIAENFRTHRSQMITLLRKVKESDLDNFALHPRLKTPMRLTDLAYFIAEHDDHHLAYMTYLNQLFSP